MTREVVAYPGFCSVERLGVFLLPPGWDASASQGYPRRVERRTVRVKCLAQENNAMSPAFVHQESHTQPKDEEKEKISCT